MYDTRLQGLTSGPAPAQRQAQVPEDNTDGQAFSAEKESPQDRITEKIKSVQDDTPQDRITAQLKAIDNPATLQDNIAAQLKGKEDNSTQGKLTTQLQAMQNDTVQRQEAPAQNQTGMPDQLKSGIENLSGYSMDDVKVHYNSSKPAQLQAHAYAQGTDIHLAPGQEKHLPHEAWHVVQQKQGRVQATTQLAKRSVSLSKAGSGVGVNDDPSLEKEADVMGAKATQLKSKDSGTAGLHNGNKPAKQGGTSSGVYQLRGHSNEAHTKQVLRDMYPQLIEYYTELRELKNAVIGQRGKIVDLQIKRAQRKFFKMGLGMEIDYNKRKLRSKNRKVEDVHDDIFVFIYNSLGTEESDTYTSNPLGKGDINNTDYHSQKGKTNKNAYNVGDYFHVYGNNSKNSNERIILNIADQNDARKLIDHIKEGVRNPDKETYKSFAVRHDMTWTKKIESMKFYASKKQKNKVKYDKVVIYFEGSPADREAIRAGIKRFFNYELMKDPFKEDISAFYNKIDKGIGYGEEIAGTSFTTISAQLLQLLSDHDIFKFADADDFANRAYDFVNNNRP